MSIIDNVRIKQNWSEDGYQFEKDATEEQKSATDEHGYFAGGGPVINVSIDAISGRERKKALDQAKNFLGRMNGRSFFFDGERLRPASPTDRWSGCPRVEELSFAEIEKRVILDLETRSQASMDPGADGDGVICYGYKVGDGPVTVKHVADWTATGRYRK